MRKITLLDTSLIDFSANVQESRALSVSILLDRILAKTSNDIGVSMQAGEQKTHTMHRNLSQRQYP